MSDKPVRTAVSYSLTYVELPPLRGIYLPLAEVLFIDRLFCYIYISGSVVTASVVMTAVIIIGGAVVVMINTTWP